MKVQMIANIPTVLLTKDKEPIIELKTELIPGPIIGIKFDIRYLPDLYNIPSISRARMFFPEISNVNIIVINEMDPVIILLRDPVIFEEFTFLFSDRAMIKAKYIPINGIKMFSENAENTCASATKPLLYRVEAVKLPVIDKRTARIGA